MALYGLKDGRLTVRLHPGQTAAWKSKRRTIAVIAGSQSGKTVFAPLWLLREIQLCGPGDYALISPTYTLSEVKAIPELLALFKRTLQLGTYTASPIRRFTFGKAAARRFFGYEPECDTHILFGYAENPDSLESATYKAICCDEAGMRAFKKDSWSALQRRLAISQGRTLITTTPYGSGGWLRELYDRWKAGDPEIDVIRFNSLENPAFPRESYERARQTLPLHLFQRFHLGMFTVAAGLIYDCFRESEHKIAQQRIPDEWDRFLGLDFGAVNTNAVFVARDPHSGQYICYREYHAGGRTAAGHVQALLQGEPKIPYCVGGSKSESNYRGEYLAAGLPVHEPGISEVELGINRVYGGIKQNKLLFQSHLAGTLEEIGEYSRECDSNGNPTDAIADKATFHYLDSLRYIGSHLFRPVVEWVPDLTPRRQQMSIVARAPRGVFGRPF